MKHVQFAAHKIVTLSALQPILVQKKLLGKTVAFTNGCFDILHEGHIFSLSEAAKEADLLVVGVNADSSVKRLKGNDRPINNEHSRALLLASLLITDYVVIFEEDTPHKLITTIMPDVLVKGGDYTIDTVVGAKEVIEHGGRVVINPIKQGFSTTQIIEQIKKQA